MTEVTAQRTERGIRVTGVMGHLGYTEVMTFPDDNAATLARWLRRDVDKVGAAAVEAVLDG